MKENKAKSNKCLAKKAKGITLIALVVTIAVLLILASVSITVVFGDNGLIEMAKEAADKTNEAVEKDLSDMQNLADEINDFVNPRKMKISELMSKPLEEQKSSENQEVEDEYGNPVTIPAGFTIVPDETDEVVYGDQNKSNDIPTVDDGIVIKDGTGNEFVWVPVFEEAPIYINDDGRNIGLLYDFGISSSPNTPPTTIDWRDTGYREPDTLSSYDDSSTYKGILEVENITDFKMQLQNEFDDLVKSVNKYKGFYIGRYETGNLSSTSKDSIPVVKKGQTPGNANWYYQY